MVAVRLLSLDLEILTWKSRRIIQPEEKALERAINAILLPAQNGKLDTGHARSGSGAM
jgi:hypothetical protein